MTVRTVRPTRIRLGSAIARLLRPGLSHKTVEPTTVRHRVKLPLIHCSHEARPEEEMTPERVAKLLFEEESEARRGSLR